jgi:PadR family transcriptional regulator, regulatory protein PadR
LYCRDGEKAIHPTGPGSPGTRFAGAPVRRCESVSHEKFFSNPFKNDMNIENAQVQMRKGILEFCILHIISRGEVYASDMLDELTSARIMVVEGTLYPLLTRLKNAGLLDYKWVESSSGPPRKYYVLTDNGKQFLDAMQETWLDLSDSVHTVIRRTSEIQESSPTNPS